jgi:hypothetical protein
VQLVLLLVVVDIDVLGFGIGSFSYLPGVGTSHNKGYVAPIPLKSSSWSTSRLLCWFTK